MMLHHDPAALSNPAWVQVEYKELARELRLTERSVRRYISELVADGLLERKRHRRAAPEYKISHEALHEVSSAFWQRVNDKPKNWRQAWHKKHPHNPFT